MAATSDIILNDYAAAAKTFTPAVQVSGGYSYADTTSSVASPRNLVIKHVMLAASAKTGTEVHSINFNHTVADSLGNPQTISTTLTFRVPRTGPTVGHRRDLWSFIRNFLTDANVEKLLIGGF
jgi:hypothetical protein